jgi:hypothetical protein
MAEPVRARRLTDQEGQRLQQIVRRGNHGSIRIRAMIIMARRSGDRRAARRGRGCGPDTAVTVSERTKKPPMAIKINEDLRLCVLITEDNVHR